MRKRRPAVHTPSATMRHRVYAYVYSPALAKRKATQHPHLGEGPVELLDGLGRAEGDPEVAPLVGVARHVHRRPEGVQALRAQARLHRHDRVAQRHPATLRSVVRQHPDAGPVAGVVVHHPQVTHAHHLHEETTNTHLWKRNRPFEGIDRFVFMDTRRLLRPKEPPVVLFQQVFRACSCHTFLDVRVLQNRQTWR